MRTSAAMRLQVLCPHYAPDTAPTGVVMTAIAEGLIDDGHELHIVTALPWYRDHAIEPGWEGKLVRRQSEPWGSVTRVTPFPSDKRNLLARGAAFVGFTGLSGIVALRRRSHVDGVLAMSPPLTLGLSGWVVARVRRAPFVFNVQDIFPDVAIDLGAITNRPLIAVARWLERFIYRRADAVTVLSEDLRVNVATKLKGRGVDKVRVIPNFVDTERVSPQVSGQAYRRENGLGDRTVVMYAGNVGNSQSLELLIEAARRLVDRRDVAFVVNGGGVARQRLEAESADLPNLHFVDYQPVERVPEVLAAGDVHVVPLKAGLARSSVPSKLYSILAAGRPVLASVDPGTEVALTVERAQAGIAVVPDDADAFVAALVSLLDDPAARTRMGAAGRSWVEGWATPAAVAASYAELFDELGTRRGRHRILRRGQ